MWELFIPNTPTWLVQDNRSYQVDIFAWITRNQHDQWSGIQAATQRTTEHLSAHSAYVQLQPGQVVTILSQPFWRWREATMLSGACVVAISTYNTT